MIGHYCIFFLVGVSLASNVAGWTNGVSELENVDVNEVNEMVKTIKKHQDYVEVCQDFLGDDLENVKTCSAVVVDIVDLNVAVANISAQAALIYTDGVKIVVKFNTCGFNLLKKEIKCLENVYTSAVALVARAKEEFIAAETQIETIVAKIKSDVSTCATSGFSSKRFDNVMTQCRSSLA